MFPENLNWDQILSTDEILFRIENPGQKYKLLKAEVYCLRPDGSRQSAVGKVVGKKGILKLPLTVSAPGVYEFIWDVKSIEDQKLFAGRRSITLQPYVNDQALARRAILSLEDKVGRLKSKNILKDLVAALNKEKVQISETVKQLVVLQSAAPGAVPEFTEQLNLRTSELNGRSKRALALAKIADRLIENNISSPIVAFNGLMWENREVNKQLPSDLEIPLAIKRYAVPDEHESISIKLLNITLDSVRVKCKVEKKNESPKVTPFEVKAVPTNQGTFAWDPIVPLSDQILTIPSLENREVWLDVDLTGADPGVHNFDVFFEVGKSLTKVMIKIEVIPFEMAGYDSMRLCCWSSYNEDAVVDLLAHGNTVFTCPLPPAKVVTTEPLKLTIDFSKVDELIKPMKGHDVYLLMSGIPILDVPMEEAAYVSRLTEYLNQVMDFLNAHGILEKNIALYPHDEPGGHGWDTINHYIAFANQGVKARPGLQFYVNGGGDLAMFEALNEVATIWCPSYFMLPDDTPVRNFIAESGKIFWTYDCGYAYARPIGANVKTINVSAQYRLPALFANHYGVTGIGYWCYNVGPSMWDAIDLEYPLVYRNDDGTHTSCRRWEAVRESIEDTRILIALRERLNDPGISDRAKKQIGHLVNVTLPVIAEQSLNEAKIGVSRYVIDASNNDQIVEKLRHEIMECVALINQSPLLK
jgi:hypothetical protein